MDSFIGNLPIGNRMINWMVELFGGMDSVGDKIWIGGLAVVALTGLQGVFLFRARKESAVASENIAKNIREEILKNFTVNIEKGEKIALVGETGSGKSTIVNLICRFYEPTAGIIEIDGTDYRERSLSWLHENIGYVLQSPHLFSGTIEDNIRFGKLEATMEEIIEAAKLVNAHEFIMKFPEGYGTEVGEGGGKLSTGEKQLISFARAVIAKPRIFVIDKGVVVEEGSHHDLMDMKGHYYKLYMNQFKENRLDREFA